MRKTPVSKEKNREYQKKHYENNREYHLIKNDKRQQKIKEWLESYKKSVKCESCPENHFATLDFHHIDPDEKDLEISKTLKQGWGIARIQKEIAKCQVLCSNCHRKLHWEIKNCPSSPTGRGVTLRM